MNRWMKSVTVAATLALATGTAWAQMSSAPFPVQVESRVRAVDARQQTVELEDGTVLTAASGQQIAQIRPGTKVKVLYVEDSGRKQIQSIQTVTN